MASWRMKGSASEDGGKRCMQRGEREGGATGKKESELGICRVPRTWSLELAWRKAWGGKWGLSWGPD